MNNQLSRDLQDALADQVPTRASASLTYEPFYGLKEKPFSLSADPRFLFKSPAHAPAYEALTAGIRRREGLIVLTGEIGTGKTTICRSVLQNLDRRTFAAFVPDPFVSREDLLKMLLVDFGVVSVSDLKRGRLNGASRPDLSYPLYEFLDSLVPLQAFAVLLIDEAQNLSSSLLEEIRILSELERREKLLQVVLVGQPELRSQLKLPQMRQVDQRISVRCELRTLDAEGVSGYVKHRLAIASDGETSVEFTTPALDVVFQGSSGVPRLINRICDRALQRAYESEVFQVDPRVVTDAINDLGLTPESDISDDWPKRVDVTVPATVPPRISTPVEQPSVPITPNTTTVPDPAVAGLTELRSGTSTEKTGSTQGKLSGVAAAAIVVLTASLGGYVWYLSAQPIDSSEITALLPPPPQPKLGAILAPVSPDATHSSEPGESGATAAPDTSAGPSDYVIQVASFKGRSRALSLVEELKTAGFRAREEEIFVGAERWIQVLVGGYSSAIEVERDLQRIRELPGYADARLLDR